MSNNPLSPELDAFIEQLGELFARTGSQRIAGRLLGFLMICDPAQQSAPDIEEAIGVSKASVSINLRLLQAAGIIERVGVAGQRRAHYQVRVDCWSKDLSTKQAEIETMRRIADNGLDALTDAPPERRERLEAMRAFYEFFERAFPAVIDQWEREREAETK